MKKVLIITYAFPPSNDIAVHRILRFGKWLPNYGWKPVILTPKYRYFSRIDYNNLRFRYEYFKKVYEVSSKIEYYISNILDSNKKSIFHKMFRRFAVSNIIPDQFIPWFISAVKEGVKITKEEKIDAIWATLNPWTDGLIGAYISKKTGVPLLIDYRDPWTLSKFHKHSFLKRKVNTVIEKRMLKYAKVICTTSKPMSRLFVDNNYFDKKSIFTITNSFDEELQYINNTDSSFSDLDKNKINITYIGTFYGDRQPFTFIKAIANLIKDEPVLRNKIQINFWGTKKYKNIKKFCDDCNIFDMFSLKGFLSYKQSMEYIRESGILLLLNGEADYNNVFIPGKLFDYLAVKKPILFIGKGQPAEIIKEINIGESASHNPSDIKEKLKIIINNLEYYKPDNNNLQKYHSKYVTRKLADILNNISNQ